MTHETLDDLFAIAEAEASARFAKEEAEIAARSPEARAKAEVARVAAALAEHANGVRLGWWDEDGDPIPNNSSFDDDEDDEEA